MITGSSVITVEQNGRQATYKFLATLDELKKTGQLTRWIDDHDVLLYEYEGEIKALSNICRHFGGPVGYHKHKDGVFTCLGTIGRFPAKMVRVPRIPLTRSGNTR